MMRRAARLFPLAVLVAVLMPAPAMAGRRWLWPVRGAVVGRFAIASDRFAAGQRRGIDIAAAPGVPVRAACGGRVSFAGVVPAAGRTVTVACGPLNATYLHLGSVVVHRGTHLLPGVPLGAVASGGRLRLGARIRARRFGYVDPLRLLGADPPGAPPALGPRRPMGPGERAPRRVAPVRLRPMPGRAPAATLAPSPAPAGLPLRGLWLPAGFALLVGGFAVTAAGRLRAAGSDLGGQQEARMPACDDRRLSRRPVSNKGRTASLNRHSASGAACFLDLKHRTDECRIDVA